MQQLANARTNINRSRFLRSGAKGISERELMAGYRPSDSARLEDKLNTLLKRDRALAASLGQLQDLIHGLSRSQRR